MTLIAVLYNFIFVSESLLDKYEEIKKEKNNFKRPCAILNENKISLKNINESLDNYWQEHISSKKLLIQLEKREKFNWFLVKINSFIIDTLLKLTPKGLINKLNLYFKRA